MVVIDSNVVEIIGDTVYRESIEALLVVNRSGLGGDSVMEDSIDDEAVVSYVFFFF